MNQTTPANVRTEQSSVVTSPNRNPQPNLRPEWLRVPDVQRVFGFGKTHLYELIALGKVKSMALKKRGAQRGIRLISYDSLVEYCEAAAAGAQAPEAITGGAN